jgi:hypothetical protein
MITYYILGNWMGPIKTVSSTVSHKGFDEYVKKYNFVKDDEGVYRNDDAKIVITEDMHDVLYEITIDPDWEGTFENFLNSNAEGIIKYQVVAGGETGLKYEILFLDLESLWRTAYRWGRLNS